MSTVILTRYRPDGVGFSYLKPMWDQMSASWVNAIDARPMLAPYVVLDATGFSQEHVAAQQGELRALLGPDIGLRVVMGPRAFEGNRVGYWSALESAYELGFSEPLIVEDDLEWCGNGYLRALTFPIPPDLDIVSFFAPHVFKVGKMYAGLWRSPAPLGSTACLKIRRHALAEVLNTPHLPDRSYLEAYVFAGDQALELARQRLKLRWGAHCPELVQHRGEISTMGDELSEGRVSLTWASQLDALALGARHELYL